MKFEHQREILINFNSENMVLIDGNPARLLHKRSNILGSLSTHVFQVHCTRSFSAAMYLTLARLTYANMRRFIWVGLDSSRKRVVDLKTRVKVT